MVTMSRTMTHVVKILVLGITLLTGSEFAFSQSQSTKNTGKPSASPTVGANRNAQAGAQTNSPGASKGADTVLATVGDQKIMLKDFEEHYDRVMKAAMNPPTKEQFLEDLIRQEAGVLEARKKGYDRDPRVVSQIKQSIYAGFLEMELGAQIQKKDKPTQAEMKNYYDKNPELRFSFILIEYKMGSTPDEIALARKRATEIYSEVKASKKPFKDLAKLYSDDPFSRDRGGDAGWHSRTSLVPHYYETLLRLKVNEITGLIQTTAGFHIVQLTDRRSFESADTRQIRLGLYEEHRAKLVKELTDKVKKNYPITINRELLK